MIIYYCVRDPFQCLVMSVAAQGTLILHAVPCGSISYYCIISNLLRLHSNDMFTCHVQIRTAASSDGEFISSGLFNCLTLQ